MEPTLTGTTHPESGIIRAGSFGSFYQRFDELIASASQMTLYFIHSRRWRENHDASIKSFAGRSGTSLEVFLPDLENHELMYSLARHFEDGPQIPALLIDAYRYCARLAREFGKPAHVWLFNRYPTYTFYRFDDRAVIALYSNTATKKELPALEVTAESLFGRFLEKDIEDLRKECRKATIEHLDRLVGEGSPSGSWDG